MAEKIALTPPYRQSSSGEYSHHRVDWFRTNYYDSTMYLPKDSANSELAQIQVGNIRLEDLEVIGKGGNDKSHPATVYKTPEGNALRVVHGCDRTGQGGLDWLRANLTLKVALGLAGELSLFHQSMVDFFFKGGVKTPTYLGYLNSEPLGSAYLMTDESIKRDLARVNDSVYPNTFGAFNYAKESIAKVYGDGWVSLDPTPGNCLLGDDDIVILDAIPGPRLFDS